MGIRFRCQACDKKLNVKAFLGGKRGICPNCGAKIAIPPAEGQPPVDEAAAARQATVTPATTATLAQNSPSIQAQPAEQAARPSPQIAASVSSDMAQPVSQPTPAQAGTQPPAAPADPLAETTGSVWYVRPPSGGQYGPASAEYMRRWIEEGRISGDSLVWREGWPDWVNASTALAGLLGASSASAPAPAPVGSDLAGSQVASTIATGDSTISKRSGGRRKKRSNMTALASVVVLCLIGVGLLVALIMVVMNQS